MRTNKAIALIMGLALLLAACGGDGAATTTAAAGATTTAAGAATTAAGDTTTAAATDTTGAAPGTWRESSSRSGAGPHRPRRGRSFDRVCLTPSIATGASAEFEPQAE